MERQAIHRCASGMMGSLRSTHPASAEAGTARPRPWRKSPAKSTIADPASDKTAALALTPVSRETEARLDRYVDLLVEWQAKTNLVAPSTLPNLWTRHVADLLQLLSLAPSAKVWADLGSGGGFPGRGAGLRAGGDAGRQRPPGRAQRQEGRVPARSGPRNCRGRRPCIWRASGILWIESAAESIASLRGRWLRYISLSVSRNRW